jgi:hypothetical protein
MDDLIQNILTSIRTTRERDEIQSSLSLLQESLYRSFPDEFHSVLERSFGAHVGTMMKEHFNKPSYVRNVTLVKSDIEKIIGAVKSMRVVRLEIAIEPNTLFVDKISQWMNLNVGTDVVLEIQRDMTVVGGARIVFEGKYKENTLAEMIQQVFAKKQNVIVKELQ